MAKRLNTSSKADRISELPGHIRQRILSYVHIKDAIATSLLSKTWMYDCLNLPCFVFGMDFVVIQSSTKYSLNKNRGLRFLEFVRRALTGGDNDYTPAIEKLHLYLPPLATELCPVFATDFVKVQELLYEVSRLVLRTQSLTELHLTRCNLASTSLRSCTINLPALRDLTLEGIQIDDLMVENLVANCTSIECLRFTKCRGFKLLKVSGLPKLRLLKQTLNDDLKRVEVNAPSLCLLSYTPNSCYHQPSSSLVLASVGALTHLELGNMKTSKDGWVGSNISTQLSYLLEKLVIRNCNLIEELELKSLRTCKRIMHLELDMCDITDDWLNQSLEELPNLEDLTLAYCHRLKHIKILHSCLRKLCIKGCKRLDRVEGDYCFNISHFSYSAYCANVIDLSLETVTLAHACIDLRWTTIVTNNKRWHAKVLGFLMKLKHSKYLSLTLNSDEDVKEIAQELRQSCSTPLCEVEHLDLSLVNTEVSKPLMQIMDDILWLFPRAQTVQLRCFSTSLHQSLKFNFKKPAELGREGCGCYPSLPINCWKHSMTDFEMSEKQGCKEDTSLRKFLDHSIRRGE